MKNLRTNMSEWFDRLDKRWQALPVTKQHRYTLYFFTGYVLLTVGVIFKVGLDMAKSNKDMEIKHIENPALKNKESPATIQDTLITILKNKIYEGK
ncbi:nitrogen regulatory IIA protein [Flavobacterium sp. Fl-318]|uniref:Nitrogen regulatory IIA protein n=1 Tax=Flavobacterium cupriresistens TaxID=2893885 RepID=A0ABU4R6F6_9FLAO|nr:MULTISPECIES: nitrogen regulatory IIA protein [unclassified Flavobacterium]MDX6187796.1 nitrogen regulatory IIA protein [Flavobacterium sp. Fl-318]UFH42282.1 nitrogen regulatory IIA protein [Flavobacterium sp. F-323]